jgi:hypothetical protein
VSPAPDARSQAALAATRAARVAARKAYQAFVPTSFLALACLVVSLLDLGYLLSVGGWPTAARAAAMNARASLLANFGWLAFAVGTGCFSRWVQACHRAALLVGAAPRPTRGFPLMRPYERLRALDESLEPERMAEAPPRPEPSDHAGGYRSAAVAPAAGGRIGQAPLLVWWLLWLACTGIIVYRWMSTVSWVTAKELDSLAAATNVATMALAGVIVRRMTGRLVERTERMFPPEG